MERRISRRFLRLIPVTIAATEATILTSCDFENPQKDKETSKKISGLIKQTFGLSNFYFGGHIYINNELAAEGLSPPFGFQRATRVTSDVYKTFSYYPPDLFEKLESTPWNYMLAEELKTKIDTHWHTTDGSMLGSKSEGYFICVNNNNYENNPNIIDTTHHELFHLLAATQIDGETEIYQPFREINSRYGYPSYNESANYAIAASCKDPPDDPPEGFVRCYGEWKPQEDAATIAAAVMLSDPLFLQRTSKEPALSEKTEIIKKIFEKVSGGKMNTAFFEWLKTFPNEVPWSWPQLPEEV